MKLLVNCIIIFYSILCNSMEKRDRLAQVLIFCDELSGDDNDARHIVLIPESYIIVEQINKYTKDHSLRDELYKDMLINEFLLYEAHNVCGNNRPSFRIIKPSKNIFRHGYLSRSKSYYLYVHKKENPLACFFKKKSDC